MTNAERKVLAWIDRNKIWLFACAISIVAGVLRLNGLKMESGDYTAWLKPWYYTIKDNGGLAGIGQQVGDYNVLYQLFIALMTYLPYYSLYLYKALSILFDYLMAAAAAMMVYEMTREGKAGLVKSVITYAGVLLLPTVFINSAWWAQCDSIYTTFVLFSLLALFKKRDVLAFILLSIAFQFKLQTVFVFPFLLYYYVGIKRFSLLNFLIIPAGSMLVCVLCGRSPFETFKIYAGQTQYYGGMFYNFPSIWPLISRHDHLFELAAMMLTIGVLGIGLLITMHRKVDFDRNNSLIWLIWTLWTCTLFLPALHERYAYILGVLLVVAAVVNPKRIVYVALFEVTIVICYVRFLWKDTVPARIPETLTSAMFLMGYVAYTYQVLICDESGYGIKT